MTISAKKYFINTIHHLVLLYPYLIFLLDKVFDEKDLVAKSYIQKISLDIFNLGKEKRNYEAMSYAIYFALKYDFKLEAEINLLEEAGKKEDCILMLLCYLYDKKNGNNIQEYKTIANNFIIDQTSKDETIKILNDEYWLFAYEVLIILSLFYFLRINMKKLLLSLALMSNAFLFADVNIYGLGGPHTALIDVAKEFKKDTGINVNVNFGPQKTWQDKAEKMEMPYLVHQISLH